MNRADGDLIYNHLRRKLCQEVFAETADDELLHLFVSQRDEAAFAVLVERHGPMVWGVCQRLVMHRQDAEDCFQATFLVLTRKAASIGQRNRLANWLFGVARRAALNARAARARRARHEQLYPDPPDVPANPPPYDDTRRVLDLELARLPTKYRLPLILCCLEGQSHEEAGKNLGWPTGTVAGRLSRGRKLLQTRLSRRGVLAPASALTALITVNAASAGLPARLVAASVRSATALLMAGRSAPAEVPAAVAAMVVGVLRKMFLYRVLATVGLVAGLATSLGGAAATWHWTHSEKNSALPIRAGALSPPAASRNAASVKSPIQLPAQTGAVVLSMERHLGTSREAAAKLTIYADGQVVATIPDGLNSISATDLTRDYLAHASGRAVGQKLPKTQLLVGKLPAGELENLMRFAVLDQEIFDIEPSKVTAAIREKYHAEANVRDNNDATTTTFHIQTAERQHEVSWSRLDKTAWDFPDIKRLEQLHALDLRLSQVYYVLLAGGQKQVETVVAKMNDLLLTHYDRFPQLRRLTAADLFKVTPSPDGSCQRFAFSRNQDKSIRNPLFEVAVDVPRQGEPTLAYVIPPRMPVR